MNLKLAVIAPLLTAGLVACGHASLGADSGVTRCRAIAANLSSGKEGKVPTEAQIGQVRDDFAGSDFPGLRTAGINYADAAQALIYGTGESKGDVLEAAQRQGLLQAACAEHGVALTFPAPSMEPIPTGEPVPVPALPENPYEN